MLFPWQSDVARADDPQNTFLNYFSYFTPIYKAISADPLYQIELTIQSFIILRSGLKKTIPDPFRLLPVHEVLRRQVLPVVTRYFDGVERHPWVRRVKK